MSVNAARILEERRRREQKIKEYENLITVTLKPQLQTVLDEREKIYEKISKFLELKLNISIIKENNLKQMKNMIDLGQQFYVEAKIPSTEYIYVDIGLGFHVQFTLNEALNFIEKKEKSLNSIAENLTHRASIIKSEIKIVLELIDDLMGASL